MTRLGSVREAETDKVSVASLAYAEMRLILARIIWNFDMRLADPHRDWVDNNEVFAVWERNPLDVYLLPRKME